MVVIVLICGGVILLSNVWDVSWFDFVVYWFWWYIGVVGYVVWKYVGIV